MVAELVLNKWEIECQHSPETIDKIVMNFRKRGMSLNALQYKKLDEFKAVCTIEFEDTPASATRIFSNMQRLYDVIEMRKL